MVVNSLVDFASDKHNIIVLSFNMYQNLSMVNKI